MAQRKGEKPRSGEPVETQSTEALTVAWALCVVTALLCDVGAALTWWYAAAQPKATQIATLSGLLLFAAAVVGLVTLVLLPVVYRLRRQPPPVGFTVFAVAVSLAPLAALLFLALR